MAHGFPLKPPHLQVQGTHNLHVGMPPFTLAARTAATMIWDDLGAGKQILDKTMCEQASRNESAKRIPVWSQTGIHYQVYSKYITCHLSQQMPGCLMLVFIGSLQQKARKKKQVFSTPHASTPPSYVANVSPRPLWWGKNIQVDKKHRKEILN